MLNIARGHKARKAADETRQDDDWDADQAEEADQGEEADEAEASASTDLLEDLFDPEQDVSIRVGSELLAQILGSDLEIGEEFYLQCRKLRPIGTGVLIVGEAADLEDQ